MTEDTYPDLSAEQAREHEAATGGIEARAAVLDIDVDDRELKPGEAGQAHGDDDEAVEHPNDPPVQPDV